MDKTTLWARIGDWMRNSRRSLGGNGHDADPQDDFGARPGLTDSSRPREDLESNQMAPWYRVGGLRTQVAHLAHEVQHHSELLESVGQQLSRLSEDGYSAGRTLEGLARLPDEVRGASEEIRSLGERLETNGALLRRLHEDLARVSKLSGNLADTETMLARLVEDSRKQTESLRDGLEQLRRSVSQLGDSSAAALRLLDAVRSESQERFHELSAERQAFSRRLTWFTSIAMALALLAAGLAGFAVLR